MTKTNDPQLYASGYDRNRLDRYWTNPWMVVELAKALHLIEYEIQGPIWEPAAGRGDMARALQEQFDLPVYSSDIDLGEFDSTIGPHHQNNFLDEFEVPEVDDVACQAIISNPPYSVPWRGIADDFIEHSLGFMQDPGGPTFIAMLLRSEFKNGKSKRRREKFGDSPFYFGELVLTTRPRWDYDDPDAPEDAAPRHNFSWFMWATDARAFSTYPIEIFSYMPRGFKP